MRCLPTAPTLPLKNRDLGTSRWQLIKAVRGTYISAKDAGRGVAVTGLWKQCAEQNRTRAIIVRLAG